MKGVYIMSVYEKMIRSLKDNALDVYSELLHPDYFFVRHQSGEEVSREKWVPVVTGMFKAMSEGKLTFFDYRCLYENEDILVVHHLGNFPDGTKEAILAVHTLQGGKIVRTESGATPIQ